jgi:hypothetical protein
MRVLRRFRAREVALEERDHLAHLRDCTLAIMKVHVRRATEGDAPQNMKCQFWGPQDGGRALQKPRALAFSVNVRRPQSRERKPNGFTGRRRPPWKKPGAGAAIVHGEHDANDFSGKSETSR